MGKKRTIVVSSDDDDDEEKRLQERRGSWRRCKSRGSPESRSGSSSCCKRARGLVKPTVGAGSSRRKPRKSDEVNFDDLSEDFYECLHGLKTISSGTRKMEMQELWVDKYKPCSLGDLAVHKKKVEQIKRWLEERMAMSKDLSGSNVLLITGQPGTGKSAAVHVLALELGAELCEWRTPTPTLWQEHLHNSSSGIRYMSKLDEFELFVEQVRKYRLLSSASETRKPLILLIDDLPVANGRVSSQRLRKTLNILVHSAQVPTFILITEVQKDDANDNVQHHGEALEMFLEKAGAFKVSFNPITINSIKKILSRISETEKYVLPDEWITLIAKASGGDIRHAITSLQYFCLGPMQSCSLQKSDVSSHPNNIGSLSLDVREHSESDCHSYLPFGRDETLSFFHALGKFLHNKREIERGHGKSSFLLKEQFERYPSKLEPEKALSQAHGQARSITDFLHENVLDFISDEAIQDAWTVASYLSDADYLLSTATQSTLSRMISWKYEPDHISQQVAASVAVRGVLFGNSHPSSSRWHSMRTPVLWQVDQSSRINKKDIFQEKYESYLTVSSSGVADIATEYRPAIRLLGFKTLADTHLKGEASQSCNLKSNDSYPSKRDSPDSGCCPDESEDDEIEEW